LVLDPVEPNSDVQRPLAFHWQLYLQVCLGC
jgi:hypothetical protein